jgi:tRNA-dihydrouridine synthase
MIGRGAVGNPFIFAEIKAHLLGDCYTPPTLEDKKAMALRQLSYAVADKGEAVAVAECRKQIANYFKGFRGAAHLRGVINSCLCYEDASRAVSEIED